MSDITNEEIEGRLNAQREVMLVLLERLDGLAGGLADAMEDLLETQNHQEDPGALPSSAFAVEAARLRELEQILEALRARRKANQRPTPPQ